ncbi:MAG: ATP-dependent helicase, partial [Methanobrevibacter sp.]|nr:ATP-dependent helicase [Methanobrevibacter sp.]
MVEEFNLNKWQKRAVEYYGDKPLLIDAGPGSGKTRVLIERVKYLVNNLNVDPSSLLIITFSNKAANEIINRLLDSSLSLEDVKKMHVSTIHSFCYSLLNDFGYSYEVLDDSERNLMYIYKNLSHFGFVNEKVFKKRHVPSLVKKFNELTSFKVDIDAYEKYIKENFPVSKKYIDFIHKQQKEKGENYSFPEKEINDDDDYKQSWYNARYNNIVNAYRLYLKFLEREGFIDFALLQSSALDLLKHHPNALKSLKNRNILIDEFQDTDPIQMEIFSLLKEESSSLTVVGDGEQSIYGFRGANVGFFNNFQSDFDAELIHLNTNYRSNQNIVKFTENFIKSDRPKSTEKQLEANKTSEDQSVFYILSKDKEFEADRIAEIIKYLKESGKIANYSDVGILGRSIKRKVTKLTQALSNEEIPYDVIGTQDLIGHDEVKTLVLLIYYLIENDEKPYIRTQWEREWLNLSGFASESFNSANLLKLSPKTRKIFLELEDNYKEQVLKVEKEVYKEETGKASRIKKFDGVFNRDEELLIKIFKKVQKPILSNYTRNDLKELGIHDEHDLNFFDKLYNLKRRMNNERTNEN